MRGEYRVPMPAYSKGCMAKEEFLESDRAPAQYISERVRMGFGSRCICKINEAGDGRNNYEILDDVMNVSGILNVQFQYRYFKNLIKNFLC